jgi:hypothetical protein
MTISSKTLISFVAAGALGLLAAPVTAQAAPDASEDDVDVEVDEEDDEAEDCDESDDDCENEGHVSGGCSGTIAPDLGQSIGGLLCTLGLLGWQLRRRRGA